jgi:spore protease
LGKIVNGDNMNKIDLKNYQLRTDLIVETITTDKIKNKEQIVDNIKISEVSLTEEEAKLINKKKGNYITIEFDDVSDIDNKKKVESIFASNLKQLLKKNNITEDDKCLIVGLGNEKSTPDSLGPRTIDNILVTNHLFEIGGIEEGFRCVAAINPGVMGTTGIETSTIIKSLIEGIKPDFVIAIDALAASSISRVNKTIQLTDTGIHPGSGVTNSRKEISFETMNIPVIAIGIPTVVDAVTIVSDTIGYISKHFAYHIKNIDNKTNRLIPRNRINYLNSDSNITKEEKNILMGEIGKLTDNEIKELLFDVLTPIGSNLMVTPKEVDFVINDLSLVLSGGINKSLHKKLMN